MYFAFLQHPEMQACQVLKPGQSSSLPGSDAPRESSFVLFLLRYQQWAWRIFTSFEKYSKVESGYAGLEVSFATYDLLPDILQRCDILPAD